MYKTGDCVLVPWTQGPPQMRRMRGLVLGEADGVVDGHQFYVYLLNRNRWPGPMHVRDDIVLLYSEALMPAGICRHSEIQRVARKFAQGLLEEQRGVRRSDQQQWLVALDDLLERLPVHPRSRKHR